MTTYRPGTSWTDVVWTTFGFRQICAGAGFIEYGWGDAWVRRDVPTDILRYLRGASNPLGHVACLGVGADDHAYLVTPDGVTDKGVVVGQNPVGLYWSDGWVAVLQRTNFVYSVGGRLFAFPTTDPDGTSQGFRDVTPDGTIVFGDDAHAIEIGGVQLHEPNTRGLVTVGQIDGTDQIDGVRITQRFASIEGRAFEPHLAWNGLDDYAVVARTLRGAALSTHPPFPPPVVIDPPQPVERPRCTITSYPTTVKVGEPAVCTAEYSGGPVTRAVWLSRSLGEALWFTEDVQDPPAPLFAYHFPDAGTVDIALHVDGPGGSDDTTSLRRITVEPQDQPEPPDPGPPRQQVAFGPNLGTLDLTRMFTEPQEWTYGRERISAYQLYQGHIIEQGAVFAGANTFDLLEAAGVFWKLKEWGILLELQTAESTAGHVLECADKIAGAGGVLGGVCFDHAFIETTVEQFIQIRIDLQAKLPNLQVGVYCPYPTKSLEEIRARLVAWDAGGDAVSVDGRPDFLRLDLDYNQRGTWTADTHRQLLDMCHDRGIAVHVIVNAKEGITDAQYIAQARAWFDTALTIGTWDAVIVQSWASTPSDELRYLPHNLPESDPSAHAWLLRYVLERFPA